jgi:GH15 family glucan-1,4-alpha-glucosidase
VGIIEKHLMKGGFLLRYRTAQSDKHSVAGEGAFLLCSFWLADYYSLVGRRGAAQRLLNRLMKIRNDVGLLSEEYHLGQRRLVGNFPQALSHVALVNTIINLNTVYGPAHQRANSHQRGKRRRVRKAG